jgi:hypothetical protein
MDLKVSSSLGFDKTQIYKRTYSLSLNWDIEFHIHKNALLLAIGVKLTHNLTRKRDQPIVYTS